MKAKLVKESLNEYSKNINIYEKFLEPKLDEIAMMIREKIESGEWQIYEVLSEPGEEYKYGNYYPHEPWVYFDQLYREILPVSAVPRADESDELTEILVRELEKNGLLRLEW